MAMLDEFARDAVHGSLPTRWRVGPVTHDPGRHAFWSAPPAVTPMFG